MGKPEAKHGKQPVGASLSGAREDKGERLADEVAAAGRKAELKPPERSRFLVVRVLDRFVEALGVAVLSVVVLLLFVNAAGRYLFGSPLGGTEEIATGLVVWLALIGVFIAVRRNDLIVVRVVVNRFPKSVQRPLHMVMTVVGLGALGYLVWNGLEYLDTFGSDTTPYFALPQGVFFAAVPVGVTAIMLALLANIRRPPHSLEEELTKEAGPAPADETVRRHEDA